MLDVSAGRCHDVTVKFVGRLLIREDDDDDHVFMYHVDPTLDRPTSTTDSTTVVLSINST